jgi:hypothetical protein
VISPGRTELAHQSPTASRQQKVAVAVIGLAMAARIARDRRTYERVIIFALVLAAAVSLARDNQARSLARLAAWDKRRTLAGQRHVKAPRS